MSDNKKLAQGAKDGKLDLTCPVTRRGFVKGLTCNHKEVGAFRDEHGFYSRCDKDGRECLIGGRCPH